MPGGSEIPQPGAGSAVPGNTRYLQEIKTSVEARRCSSTESHQTCSHLPQQQCPPVPNEPPYSSESPTVQQSQLLAGQQGAVEARCGLVTQPPTSTTVTAGQQQVSQLASQLLELPNSGLIKFAARFTLKELREVIGYLNRTQLLQVHEQLVKLQHHIGSANNNCSTAQATTNSSKNARRITPDVAAAALVATLHTSAEPGISVMCLHSTRSHKTSSAAAGAAAAAVIRPGARLPAQQQQPAASLAVAGTVTAGSVWGCAAVKPVHQCSADELQVLHPTCLRARFERLSADKQGVILLELEQLEEVEQARRAKRAKREAAATARAEAAAAVQLRKSKRQCKDVGVTSQTTDVNATARAAATSQQQQVSRCDHVVQQSRVDISAAAAATAACAGSFAEGLSSKPVCPSWFQDATTEPEPAAQCAHHTARQQEKVAVAAAVVIRRLGCRAQARKRVLHQ